MSKYLTSSDLIKDVRKLHYNQKATLLQQFCVLLKMNEDWNDSMFAERFYETFQEIEFDDDVLDDFMLDHNLEWTGYAENDFANALREIDINDPMTFLLFRDKLESEIKKLSKK